jgi:hypothetical protein
MRGARGHTKRQNNVRDTYKVLVGNPEGKSSFRRLNSNTRKLESVYFLTQFSKYPTAFFAAYQAQ